LINQQRLPIFYNKILLFLRCALLKT